MTRKVHKCLICGGSTVAENKLCKKPECRERRLKERMHVMPAHESGVFISLVRCTHGILLDKPCGRCEREWDAAQNEVINDD